MQEKQVRMKKAIIYLVSIGLMVLSVLAMIKTCVVGFDIDEAYAVAQSYRLAIGDKMFMHMWEPHQMSAFFSALFMFPFLLITGGETVGVVLYLRVVGTIIHLLIGYWFFKVARKKFGVTMGLLFFFVHVNFLSKWIVLPEFELMQYWATCVIFLALVSWCEVPKTRYLMVSGGALFVALMTYPTMILLYPVYVIGLLVAGKGNKKDKWIAVLRFTLVPFILGIAFLIYLRSYMTLEDFFRYISYVFMDESHSVSFGKRWSIMYAGEWRYFGELAWNHVPFAIVGVLAVLGVQILMHRKQKEKIEKRVSVYVLLFLILWISGFLTGHIFESVFADKNQFYLYVRFLAVAVLGFVGAGLCFYRNKVYLWFGLLPGIVGVTASLLITNMTLEVALARIYIGVIATLFIMCSLLTDKFKDSGILRVTGYVATVLFILGLLICKLVLVRITGCISITINMNKEMVTCGPVAGIYMREDYAGQYNENIPVLEDFIEPNDKVLYFGCENVYYMIGNATLATPSVQGTAVFDDMYLKYYEEIPDRLPNVVIIDKNFSLNQYYNYKEENQIVLDWIKEEFVEATVTETTNLILLRR